ncbi:MAG: hypothetical protein MK105_12375 [Crocinitomicaceae bacterium]|nr:hypothetical protein [Crocinitomicaceae bacterium]
MARIDEQKQWVPTCPNETRPLDCFKKLINNVDVIFEGTVIDNRLIQKDEKFFIRTIFSIHKVFKGLEDNIPDSIIFILETRAPDTFDSTTGTFTVNLRDNEYFISGNPKGTTGIVLADRNDAHFKRKFCLIYHLTQDTPEFYLSKEEIAIISYDRKNMYKFKSTKVIYALILDKLGQKTYRDISKMNFRKE